VTRPTCENSLGMSSVPRTAYLSTHPLSQNDVDDPLFFSSTHSDNPSFTLAATASPCTQRLQRLQCLMHMSHSRPISQHFLLGATISHSCTLQEVEHPYPTQAMSHICLVSPGATSSVALPKSSPLNDVPRRLPTPSPTSSSVHATSLAPSTSGSRDLGPCRWISDHSSTMSFCRVQDILLDESASACWGVERWMFRFRFLHDHRCRCRCRASLRTRAQVLAERAESPFNSYTSLHPKDKVSE